MLHYLEIVPNDIIFNPSPKGLRTRALVSAFHQYLPLKFCLSSELCRFKALRKYYLCLTYSDWRTEEHLPIQHCHNNSVPVNKICHTEIEIPSGITHSQPHTERIQQKRKKTSTRQQNKPTTARKRKGKGPLKEQHQDTVYKLKQQSLNVFKEANSKD